MLFGNKSHTDVLKGVLLTLIGPYRILAMCLEVRYRTVVLILIKACASSFHVHFPTYGARSPVLVMTSFLL